MAPRKPAPASVAPESESAKPRAPRAGTRKSAPKTAQAAAKGGTKAKGTGRKAAPTKTEAAPKKTGRPSTFTQAIADELCERIALGETLTSICQEDGKPTVPTVWRWQRADEEFRKALAHAREEQTRAWADQIIDLADDSSQDWTTRTRANGQPETVLDREHVERVKLRLDNRKWLMARVNRQDYGDKQQIDHNHSFAELDTRELARKVRELLDKLGLALTDEDLELIGL